METSKIALTSIKNLQLKKELCEQNIIEYQENIYQTKLLIRKINEEILNTCPSHNWKVKRESGMYGEKFTYCTVCGSIKY